MSQDMQTTDPVPHTDGSSGSLVHRGMNDSAAISHDMGNVGQEHGEINSGQYGSGIADMMFHDEFFGNLAEAENSGQVDNIEMHAAGQHEPAVKPEHHSDNTLSVFSEENSSTLRIEGNSGITHLDKVASNFYGDAVKLEPEVEDDNSRQDPLFMYESGYDGDMHSPAPQHTSEPLQNVPQDTVMNDESDYQGRNFTDHTSLGGGEYGTEIHTRQAEREVTTPTNKALIWPADPDAYFEKESQYELLQSNHENVQTQQEYSGHMAPGTTDQMFGLEGRENDQPATFTREVDPQHNHETMQSGYYGNTMGMTGEEAAGQHTQPSNALLSGPWPTASMNDIQHQAFGRRIDFTNTSASSHPSIPNTTPFATSDNLLQFKTPNQCFGQQQPLNPYDQSPVDALFTHQQQLQAQVEQKKRQLENARRLHEQTQHQVQQVNSFSFAQNQASVPASFLMGPLSYQRAPQSGYRQVPSGNKNASHWPQMQSGSSQIQMTPNEGHASYPTHGEGVIGKSMDMNKQTSEPSAVQVQSKTQQQDQSKSRQQYLKEEESDDNEPLVTRTKRHPSITSQTSATHQPSTPQPSATLAIAIASPPPNTTPAPSTSIDWKLPQYDLQLEPTPTDPSQPIAKISLPGLVREEILLSPDHADQEIHLLLNVFLPGQRALTTPDPQPAAAVLNFHTIALMVIEAYVQYEIGDELGRRNPCYTQSQSGRAADAGPGGTEAEYERIRDARSADVDEIFFAVVDRWRAGRESGRQSLGLIRGVQEFCEVALDVIYYVKEHGLLGGVGQQEQEGEMEEEEVGGSRKDGGKAKGKGKGKAVDKEEGVAVLKAKPKGKRAAPTEKAETGARKKGKVAVKKEEPKKRGRKPAAITVVKK